MCYSIFNQPSAYILPNQPVISSSWNMRAAALFWNHANFFEERVPLEIPFRHRNVLSLNGMYMMIDIARMPEDEFHELNLPLSCKSDRDSICENIHSENIARAPYYTIHKTTTWEQLSFGLQGFRRTTRMTTQMSQ